MPNWGVAVALGEGKLDLLGGAAAGEPGGEEAVLAHLGFDLVEPALHVPPANLALYLLEVAGRLAIIGVDEQADLLDLLGHTGATVTGFVEFEVLQVAAVAIVDHSFILGFDDQEPFAATVLKYAPDRTFQGVPGEEAALLQALSLAHVDVLENLVNHVAGPTLHQGGNFSAVLEG